MFYLVDRLVSKLLRFIYTHIKKKKRDENPSMKGMEHNLCYCREFLYESLCGSVCKTFRNDETERAE